MMRLLLRQVQLNRLKHMITRYRHIHGEWVVKNRALPKVWSSDYSPSHMLRPYNEFWHSMVITVNQLEVRLVKSD